MFIWLCMPSAAFCQSQKTANGKAINSTANDLTAELADRLELAGSNRGEIEKALNVTSPQHRVTSPQHRVTSPQHRKAVTFLVRNMRKDDLRSLSAEFILENVQLAFQAKKEFEWQDKISDEMFLNEILPFAVITEQRESWRKDLMEICRPIVKDCKTTRQAAMAINQHLFKIIKVKYSRKRKKAVQSPSESIEQGKASCTGLAILLVDACRSVNVPARLVGIPSWTTKRGNHTWVEVWADGDWHFTGAAEFDPKGLDRGWFVKDASQANKAKRWNSIYAVSFARTETTFPIFRSRDPGNKVYAVNVTDRYTRLRKSTESDENKIAVRIRVWNSGRTQRVSRPIEIALKSDQSIAGQGSSNGAEADMNDLFEARLNKNTNYEIRVGKGDQTQRIEFTTSDAESELVEIELKQD